MPHSTASDDVAMEYPVGRRLLPQVVDSLAEKDPNRRFCTIPSVHGESDGWATVTYSQLAHAVNFTAEWIKNNMGVSSNFETITYMAVNDIRYCVFVLAAIKTGHKVLLSSTRNSNDAHLYLLETTGSNKFVFSPEYQSKVRDLTKARPALESWEIPSWTKMMTTPSEPFPYTKNFDEAINDPVVIIHSSGTTGMPKPVNLTNGYVATFDHAIQFPLPEGRSPANWAVLGPHDNHLSITPFFHLMGHLAFWLAIFLNVPSVLAPDKPLTSQLLLKVLDETNPTAGTFPPSTLEELLKSPGGPEAISRLKCIFFGGAPLSPEAGSQISKLSEIQSIIGSTEACIFPTLRKDKEDWGYFEWNPRWGIDMQPIGEGLYELVIPRAEFSEQYHGVFHCYPDLKEWRTNDVFEKHPTKEGLWRFKGRIDDVIVLSNGEKFNPTTMEKLIEGNKLVSRAMIIGHGRFQSALLLEPNWKRTDGMDDADIIDQVWPTIEEANKVGQRHAQIFKSKVGVAKKEKPFQVTPKGTIKRRVVADMYKDEIDELYATEDVDYEVPTLPEAAGMPEISAFIQQVLSGLLPDVPIENESDMFSLGLDSLQALRMARMLQSAVVPHLPQGTSFSLTSQTLYTYPTIVELSKYIHSFLTGNGDLSTTAAEEDPVARAARLDSLIKKYTQDLPELSLELPPSQDRHHVILTGSTGSLGNYILHVLLKDPKVSKVTCLNRSDDAQSRQVKSFQEKGLDSDLKDSSRVEFLQAQFGEENFGLNSQKYTELTKTVDTIIHNAWAVNFNHKVESFEKIHIRGVRRFIDFSIQSTYRAHIHFVSSVSTVMAWKPSRGPTVPELIFPDTDAVLRQGYGESKYIGERLCSIASSRSGVPTSIHRVGQIAGPSTEKGVWNRQEWLPALVATSKSTGKIPSDLGSGPVDWIPVDTMAKIITDIAQARRQTSPTKSTTAAFNLVNPTPTPWAKLIPTIQEFFPVTPISLNEWIDSIASISSPTEEDYATKPAIKILDFFRGLAAGDEAPLLQTEKAQEASEAMKTLGPIDEQLMKTWLKQWNF